MNFKSTLAKGILLFVILVSSCKKEEHLNDQSIHLAGKLKEEYVQYNGNIKFLYFYDQDKTLLKQEQWAEGILLAANEYRYLDGKLYFRTYSTYAGPNAPLRVFSVSKYTYTGELLTRVVENVLERHGLESDIVTSLYYDDEGSLTFARRWQLTAEGYPLMTHNFFKTDAAGNILTIKEVNVTNGVTAKPNIYSMKYDDKHNPRYRLVDPLEFSHYFSPNNVIGLNEKTPATEHDVHFLYQYNIQQMPLSLQVDDVVESDFRDVAKWIYY